MGTCADRCQETVFYSKKAFEARLAKTGINSGTGLFDPGADTRCRRHHIHLLPPTVRNAGRHGWHWALSAASVGGRGP